MPSETRSFFSNEPCFSDQRQFGAKKVDHTASYSGLKADGLLQAEGVSSLPLRNRFAPNSEMEKEFGLPEHYQNRGRNASISIGKHIVGAEREAGHSLPSAAFHAQGLRANQNMESAAYFFDANNSNILMVPQDQNGLFSSSLSDLFNKSLNLSFTSAHGNSIGSGTAAPQFAEEEAFVSMKELEAQTIGNLLPDDDDLFSAVTDGFENATRPHNGEDMEDIDLFSSVGGLELGEDGFSRRNTDISDVNSVNQLGSGLIYGEHPSRTLFVRNINSNVEDAELRMLFEQFGEIRTLYTACKHRGFVMISYFDIRAACSAMKAMQNNPLKHKKLDIHFSVPKDNPSEKDMNQGTLNVFDLDPSVSNEELCKIFGVYGEILAVCLNVK